ncbi:MAG: prepilin peptidase [Oscillospiraceae bacterium]|nr:prepilin peptidase [Oscillospiraceae bacterium]
MMYDLITIYTFLVIVGACIGSFINVVISRLPIKGAFLASKRSRCLKCDKELKPYDMIPILSWLILKGHCRNCKMKIPIQYPLVELSCALLAVVTFMRFGLSLETILAFGVTVTLLAISVIDLQTSKIPNSLVIAIAVFAVAAIWFFPHATLLERVIGFFIISIPLLIITLVVNGAFGGGDIKLMAACGFLLGWQDTLLAFFIALLLGGVCAIFLISTGKRARGEHMVFGPAISLGVAISLFFGYDIISWYLTLITF